MKKFVLFSICLIAFLCTAQGSPHDGGTLATASQQAIQNATIHSDSPIVVPLFHYGNDSICMEQPRLRTRTKAFFVGIKQNISSTLYYRNFYTYRNHKPAFTQIWDYEYKCFWQN